MGTIPGYSRDAVFAAKREAQLAVHGAEYQYVPRRGVNYTIRACIGERDSGTEVYFTLWVKPEDFQCEPKKGDAVLVGNRWYVVERSELIDGWRQLLCHFQRYA